MDEYIEVFLEWSGEGEQDRAVRWLEARGLRTRPMRHGLLLTGTVQQIQDIFSTTLHDQPLPLHLPVPADLSASVASITVPAPRSYHS